MENESTKILNASQDPEPKKENVAQPKEKKGAGFGARVAATAAGAAVGTSAALAAEHIYDASVESANEVPEEIPNQEDVQEDTSSETAQADDVQEPQPTVVEHVVTVKVETSQQETSPQQEDTPIVPEDGTYIDPATPEPASGSDNEVRVLAVGAEDINGDGVDDILIGVEAATGEHAILVDLGSTGQIDGVIEAGADDQFGTQDDVAYGVHEGDLPPTEVYVQSYEHDGGNDSVQDDSMYTASADDMPDYMNDADAGVMDA